MEREALSYLDEWRTKPNRKPLVVRGARQVGKSTLARLFAARRFRRFVELDFEREPDLAVLFRERDPRRLVGLLELRGDGPIVPGEALLFLDEVQAAPDALRALRYFREELPELHVIAAGSLLETALRRSQEPQIWADRPFLAESALAESRTYVLEIARFGGRRPFYERLSVASGGDVRAGRTDRVPPPRYVVSVGPRVVPVEVKAGATGRLKSLHVFLREKRLPLGVRFHSEPPSLLCATTALSDGRQVPYQLLSLPPSPQPRPRGSPAR